MGWIMDYIVRAFQYQPKLILSSDQVLVICLRWGFRCNLCASQAVFSLTLLQESAGRIRTEFLLQCQIWEITANPHGLSTSILFYGYKPWYHRTLLQNLSPWLKKLQCNGNSTSQACMSLKRRGNDYCKAGTKTGIISTDRSMTELQQCWTLVQLRHFQKSFNVYCLL